MTRVVGNAPKHGRRASNATSRPRYPRPSTPPAHRPGSAPWGARRAAPHPRGDGRAPGLRRLDLAGGPHLQEVRRRQRPGHRRRSRTGWPARSGASASRRPTRSPRRSASPPTRPSGSRPGVLHALGQAADEGHTLLPEPDLVGQAAELLGAEPAAIDAAIAALLDDRRRWWRRPATRPTRRLLALAPFARAESGLASRLQALHGRPGADPRRPRSSPPSTGRSPSAGWPSGTA